MNKIQFTTDVSTAVNAILGIILNVPVAVTLLMLLKRQKVPFQKQLLCANLDIAHALLAFLFLIRMSYEVVKLITSEVAGHTAEVLDPRLEAKCVSIFEVIRNTSLIFGSLTFSVIVMFQVVALLFPDWFIQNVKRGYYTAASLFVWFVVLCVVAAAVFIEERYGSDRNGTQGHNTTFHVHSIPTYVTISICSLTPTMVIILGCLSLCMRAWSRKNVTYGLLCSRRSVFILFMRSMLYCPLDFIHASLLITCYYYQHFTKDLSPKMQLAFNQRIQRFEEYIRIVQILALYRITLEPILQLLTNERISKLFSKNRSERVHLIVNEDMSEFSHFSDYHTSASTASTVHPRRYRLSNYSAPPNYVEAVSAKDVIGEREVNVGRSQRPNRNVDQSTVI